MLQNIQSLNGQNISRGQNVIGGDCLKNKSQGELKGDFA
jgi:hypothetical protein